MSYGNPESGYGTGGRTMSSSDVEKVQQMGQMQSYSVAVDTLRNLANVFRMNESTHAKAPHSLENEFWWPAAGEPAVKLRGNASDEVFTGLNGLDKEAWEAYPGDPEMARLVVRAMVQFVGIVDQSARTDIDFPRVTLKFAGTVPQYAPGAYNMPGLEGAQIQFADKVIYDVPNLENPLVPGLPGKIGKIVMVPCPATKESITARILHTTAHIIHDPANYKRAMQRAEHVAHANMHTALALKNAAIMNGLMMIDLLLKNNVLAVGRAGDDLDPEQVNDSTTITTRLAEALSLLQPGEHNVAQPGAFSASLTSRELQTWNKIEFDLGQRLFPLKNPETGMLNARNEFGMRLNDLNQPESVARSLESGMILRTPAGRLLEKSLTATPLAIQAIVMSIDDDNRNKGGVAASTPNPTGFNLFTLYLSPEGGNSTKLASST